jgi:hypothetical protein
MTEYIVLCGMIALLVLFAVFRFKEQIRITFVGTNGNGGMAGGVNGITNGMNGGGSGGGGHASAPMPAGPIHTVSTGHLSSTDSSGTAIFSDDNGGTWHY